MLTLNVIFLYKAKALPRLITVTNFILSLFFSLRYQQTPVRVFAKFLAQDSDSGRTEYFPSRSTELDVTELVMGHGLRISNSGVATLRDGNIVQGLNPGRTEIKVSTTTVLFSLFFSPMFL